MRTLNWDLDDLNAPFSDKILNAIGNAVDHSLLPTWNLINLLASIQDYEESEMLTDMQASQIVFYSFMDVGIRHQTPRSETQEFCHDKKHDITYVMDQQGPPV